MGIKYETVESGELFRWDEVGKHVEGILIRHEDRPEGGGKGPGHIYEVKTKNGTLAFFAPMILHKKLSDVAIPSIVDIKMTEISETKAGNTLKLFEVGHAPATPENCKLLGIELVNMEQVETGNFGEFDK